jgi:hypothetical protein
VRSYRRKEHGQTSLAVPPDRGDISPVGEPTVSGAFSGTANLGSQRRISRWRPRCPNSVGILETAQQEIGLPGLLPRANQEIGGPGGSATASGLPFSVLRVGVVNSDFQPGRRKGNILLLPGTVGGQLSKSLSDQRLPVSPYSSKKVTAWQVIALDLECSS